MTYLWPLLALPVVGAIGWALGRFTGGRSIQPGVPAPDSEARRDPAAQSAGAAADVPESRRIPTRHALSGQPTGGAIYYVLLVPFLVLATAVVVLALHHLPVQSETSVAGGDPERGQAALQSWGCGACHTIPGVTGATGKVGPALADLSSYSYIAGRLQNTPDKMVQWIMHPQEIAPGVDMPDTGVPAEVARDMAAYLYSIH